MFTAGAPAGEDGAAAAPCRWRPVPGVVEDALPRRCGRRPHSFLVRGGAGAAPGRCETRGRAGAESGAGRAARLPGVTPGPQRGERRRARRLSAGGGGGDAGGPRVPRPSPGAGKVHSRGRSGGSPMWGLGPAGTSGGGGGSAAEVPGAGRQPVGQRPQPATRPRAEPGAQQRWIGS